MRHFEKFLHRVRRRLILARSGDCIARCGTVAIALAIPLVLALRWEQLPTGAALALLATGAAAAAMALLLRRLPTLDTAATTADRQLNLSDLLGTALHLRRSAHHADPALVETILSLADARSQDLFAAQIACPGVARRRWGRVAVAASLLCVAAGVPLPLPSTDAGPRTSDANAAVLLTPPDTQKLAGADALAASPSEQSVESTHSDQSQPTQSTRMSSERAVVQAALPSPHTTGAVGSAAAGAGFAAKATGEPQPLVPPNRSTQAAPAPAGFSNLQTTAAADGSLPADKLNSHVSNRIDAAGVGAAPAPGSSPTAQPPLPPISAAPPAATASPSPDRSVPDTYQPLLHDYFDRGTSDPSR